MKGWFIEKPLSLVEKEIIEDENNNTDIEQVKIRMTKALVDESTILQFGSGNDSNSVVLCSNGVGVVSECSTNLLGLEKGKRVYISPIKPCSECYNCKSKDFNNCLAPNLAGENFNGFLCNFYKTDINSLYIIPDSITNDEALFINQISLASSIIDKLNIQKGDYVGIIGSNNLANIISQLLMYYQAVPIVIGENSQELEAIKKTGVYYILDKEQNWNKEVKIITGGRMPNSLIYISNSDISITKAFNIAGFKSQIAVTGVSTKNNPISFASAMKKELMINCISPTYNNISTTINLLVNKAIKIDNLVVDKSLYKEIPKKLTESYKKLEETEEFTEIIVDLI